MFHHIHPYPPFIPENATKLIVGTLPPPRFTTGRLLEGDVDFCYGTRDGQLWLILDRIFDLDLKFETSEYAVRQRKDFLCQRGIGVCDMVASARRNTINASDIGLNDIELRDLVSILKEHPKINTLLLTGGNSRNGPEYLLRRHLKTYNIKLESISKQVPRIHSFHLPGTERKIKTVTLTAPSGSANRAVGSMKSYKKMKAENPDFTVIDFRIMQYKSYF